MQRVTAFGVVSLPLMVVFAAVLFAPPAAAASLHDEIVQLLKTHPQIKAARNNVAATEEGINRAFAGYLPRLNVNADYGAERTDSPGLRAARAGRSLSTARERVSVTLTENIFDGFRTTTDYESARIVNAAAGILLDSTEQNILFDGTSAYLNVLRHRELSSLAADNEDTIQEQLELEDERVLRGAGIALDVLQSKSRLQIAKERSVAFQGNLDDAITRYIQIFGTRPEVEAMSLPPLPLGQLPETRAAAEQIALAENPTAANSDRAVDLAAQRKRAAKSTFYPQLDLVGEYNFEEDEAGTIGSRRDYTVKVQANWELFSGFRSRADSAEAAYLYQVSINNHNFSDRGILEDVGLAWEQLETARERVVLLKNAVDIAAEVHTARGKLREAGKETVLNVLDAQTEVFGAQIEATGAEFDARVSVYRLNLSLGRMKPDILAETGRIETKQSIAAWAARSAPRVASAPDEASGATAERTVTARLPASPVVERSAAAESAAPEMPGRASAPSVALRTETAAPASSPLATEPLVAARTGATAPIASSPAAESAAPESPTVQALAQTRAPDGGGEEPYSHPNFMRLWPYQ